MRLIGLDPGLTHTGWGIVESTPGRLRFVASGRVSTAAGTALAARLDRLYRGLCEVLADHGPAVAAVEETVVNTNAGSSLKLGQARGVVLLAAAHAGLEVHEYASKTVKRALVGTGGADKAQVAAMVQRLLPAAGVVRADAADALAVALCHAHHAATAARLARAMDPGR
ncbi:MAG: crossover junction endodeoxyribonuclease RuvC [Pseudomonadota bacterium]